MDGLQPVTAFDFLEDDHGNLAARPAANATSARHPNGVAETNFGSRTAWGDADLPAEALEWREFAARYFQKHDASNGCSYFRGPLQGPLLRQIWGDGDSTRMLSVWVNILRFLGDLPLRTDQRLSNQQIVHLICNIALTRPNSRDEVYCQIIKQLTDNPSPPSHARCWILLAICTGIFLPSSKMLPTLIKFVEMGPPLYAPFVLARIHRTEANGTRMRPPTALEMNAAFTKRAMSAEIHFYAGSLVLTIDPASTGAEVAAALAAQGHFVDQPGFVLTACTIDFKELTPVTGKIMDAASLFEETDLQRGDTWQDMSQRQKYMLVFRKERFEPWAEAATNLGIIYAQIEDGLRRGHYKFATSAEIIRFIANRCFIEFGAALSQAKLLNLLATERIHGLHEKTNAEWAQLITTEFNERGLSQGSVPADDLRQEAIAHARQHWALEFSRQFSHIGVRHGARVYNDVTIAVNNMGVFLLNKTMVPGEPLVRENVLEVLFWTEFTGVAQLPSPTQSTVRLASSQGMPPPFTFEMNVVSKPEPLVFGGSDARALFDLVDASYKGLCQRSHYLVAILPYRSPTAGDSRFLELEVGDLIQLPAPWHECDQGGGWARGGCLRSGQTGDFPIANAYVLPCTSRPPDRLLALFRAFIVSADDS